MAHREYSTWAAFQKYVENILQIAIPGPQPQRFSLEWSPGMGLLIYLTQSLGYLKNSAVVMDR